MSGSRPIGFVDANTLADESVLRADLCIIGSGAGGAVVAAELAARGRDVLVVEEGSYYTKADFHMREDEAFPTLYQESGKRTTKDVGIAVLQGRAVGGSTVVNWTTCFRTPAHVLEHWIRVHGVEGLSKKELDPHWDVVEQRLNIKQIGLEETNRNNRLLYDGCKALGIAVETTFRNTRGCFKSGYCGVGCPVDAKQSMNVTYLPDAVAKQAGVVSRCRVDRLEQVGSRVTRAHASVIGPDGYHPSGKRLIIEAEKFILSAGAIGSPAILIRSGIAGEHVGKRTFLHPVIGTSAHFKDPVEPYYGAPQSVAAHGFADRGEKVGFFLEAAPLQPMLAAMSIGGFGEEHARKLAELPHTTAHIALTIDGFHPEEPGGTVSVRPSGAPMLDYQIPPRIWEALRESMKTLARVDLAAGAEYVISSHDPAVEVRSEKDLAKLDQAQYELHRLSVFSAHVMGGCQMGTDPARSVVRSHDLRHHQIENLHVIDGSIFPTSLAVNPQETIYGIAHLVASRL